MLLCLTKLSRILYRLEPILNIQVFLFISLNASHTIVIASALQYSLNKKKENESLRNNNSFKGRSRISMV